MSITIEEARELVKQQQISHRLIAGFYQNILKEFEKLANSCGYTFRNWWPSLTDRPCRNSTNPSSKWIWDFLPLYASTFEYVMENEPEQAQLGNCVIVFNLRCDEGFSKACQRTGYVDPVDLNSEQGSIEIRVFRCFESPFKGYCYELYQNCGWPEQSADEWQDVGCAEMKAHYKRYPLEEFIAKKDEVLAYFQKLIKSDYKVAKTQEQCSEP